MHLISLGWEGRYTFVFFLPPTNRGGGWCQALSGKLHFFSSSSNPSLISIVKLRADFFNIFETPTHPPTPLTLGKYNLKSYNVLEQ